MYGHWGAVSLPPSLEQIKKTKRGWPPTKATNLGHMGIGMGMSMGIGDGKPTPPFEQKKKNGRGTTNLERTGIGMGIGIKDVKPAPVLKAD